MEPRIQYAKTTDGVSIAFWTLGEGTPCVNIPNHVWSHIQQEWQDPGYRRWYERLADKRKLIRYDGRGSGLSDRNVADYSVDTLMLDLEAVVERLGVQTFVLLSPLAGAPVAIDYAARHPEAVSHLLLWCPWVRQEGRALGLWALRRDEEWEVYTEATAHVAFGWSAGEEARRYAAYMRECTTPEAARASHDVLLEFDVTAVLSKVRSPTLILQRRQGALLPGVEIARGLASGIPDARLVLLEGESVAPWIGDMEAVLAAIDEFVSEGEEATAPAAAPSGLVTILFTDMESSTALTQRLGDAKAQEVLRSHNTIVRDALRAHSGSEIKHTGDGIMASFPSASQALQGAIAIQQRVAAHTDTPFRVRIGLNAGEPIAEEQDLFGTAVQLASRVCDHADPGQILVSDVVRQLAMGKGFLFSDHGDVELRGFEDPVRLYEVRWREEA
jgi:class 3 adenylate cyclase